VWGWRRRKTTAGEGQHTLEWAAEGRAAHDTKDSFRIMSAALLEAAEGGDAEAQAGLGYSYLQGEGVERNPELGVSWLRRSADQGFGSAHYLLATCSPAVDWMKLLTSCLACGAGNTHRVCAKCVAVSFCDARCQSRCWPHPHRAHCRGIVRAQEASLGVDHGETQP
jgi:hypothetical protein